MSRQSLFRTCLWLIGLTLLATSVFLCGEIYLRISQRLQVEIVEQLLEKRRQAISALRSTTKTDSKHVNLWKKRWVEYEPNRSSSGLQPDGSLMTIQINRQGFRTQDIEKKQAGTVRILAIGGSTTFKGKTNAETYPALLEKLLSEKFPDKKIEVFNLGVSGSTSDYWVERLQQLLSYEPDIVIQYNAINDILWRFSKRLAKDKPLRKSLSNSLLFQALFPIPPKAFADYIYDFSFKHFSILHQELTYRNVVYVASTFATPDISEGADKEIIAILNTKMKVWGKTSGIAYYENLFDIVQFFNQELRTFTRKNGINLADVSKELTQPNLFKDVCHFEFDAKILQARAFEPVISHILKSNHSK